MFIFYTENLVNPQIGPWTWGFTPDTPDRTQTVIINFHRIVYIKNQREIKHLHPSTKSIPEINQ